MADDIKVTLEITKHSTSPRKYPKGYRFVYEHQPHIVTSFVDVLNRYTTRGIEKLDLGDGRHATMSHVLSEADIDACEPIKEQ